MRRVMYLASSVNACCADEGGASSWSDEQWESFIRLARRYKNVIVGRKGFEFFNQRELFKDWGDVRIVVVSTTLELSPDSPHTVVHTISEALSQISVRQETHVLYGGGVKLNSDALSQGAVDEIIWDIEPLLVRKGTPMLEPLLIQEPLDLISVRKIGRGTIQLQYATVRAEKSAG